jgi:NADH oxidase (H2O2-forming)
MSRKVIVIGSGAAGLRAASTVREHGDESITVFTEEEHIAYSPCAIPYVLEGKIKDFGSIVMHTPEFYAKERGIDVRTKTKVAAVDIDKKEATLAGGSKQQYDALIVATGGTVFMPPVPGLDLKGVYPVRWISDGMAVQQAMKGAERAVVAGAGVIGLEVAHALRAAGLEVTVVEMFKQTIPRICDADMAALVQAKMEAEGVRFMMGAPIAGIKGEGRVRAVAVGNVDVPADIVIMATGVRANLELPTQMGLDISPLGAVRVSATLQPYKKGRLVNDVYLAGDLITCESAVAGGPTMSQLGSAAVRQGRVAGINAAGGYATYPPIIGPWVSVVGGLEVGGCGLSKSLAEYYGLKTVEATAEGWSRARYYPGGGKLTVKLMADAETRRLLGAQAVGAEGVTGRVNWISAALLASATVEEFVTDYENAYCPPTSMVKDVVNLAAEALAAKLKR